MTPIFNRKVNVLLIESGGSGSHITDIPYIARQLIANTSISQQFYTTVQDSGACDGLACKLDIAHVLGGGSTHNFMIYVLGSRQDFNDWTKFGIKGWKYSDVLHYMVELETYEDSYYGEIDRGTRGPVHVTRQVSYPFDDLRERWKAAALELGYEVGDYNGPRQTYFADVQKNVRNGVRQSTDNVFLKPIMKIRPNLNIIMFSHVTRILFKGNEAIGVEYSRNGTLHKVMASREVILSAGALASPKILMLSGIGSTEELHKHDIKQIVNLSGVGRNYQDHLSVDVRISSNQKFPKNSGITKENYEKWKTKGTGILAASNGFSKAYITTNYSYNSNDSQITYTVIALQDDLDPSRVQLSMSLETAKTYSRGYVKLRNKDPKAHVIVNPRYLSRIEDKQNHIEGLKKYLELMKSNPFKQIGAKLIIFSNTKHCSEQFKLYSDNWLYCYIQKNSVTSYHPSGTCKMGSSSDPMAVVDERLRVRNVKRLRVIDASIMPQVTRGNTNAPVMMIGLKGADMIRQDWRI